MIVVVIMLILVKMVTTFWLFVWGGGEALYFFLLMGCINTSFLVLELEWFIFQSKLVSFTIKKSYLFECRVNSSKSSLIISQEKFLQFQFEGDKAFIKPVQFDLTI